MQRQIRTNITPKSSVIFQRKTVGSTESKECDVEESEVKIEDDDDERSLTVEEPVIVPVIKETESDNKIETAIKPSMDINNDQMGEMKTEIVEQNDDEQFEEILDDVAKSEDIGSSLPAIDEQKEEQQTIIDENEKERLEREQLEQDLMEDYTQSESFSGIDCLPSDFLQQYQKHIENMNNS